MATMKETGQSTAKSVMVHSPNSSVKFADGGPVYVIKVFPSFLEYKTMAVTLAFGTGLKSS